MEKILLLGATGPIGQEFTRRLKEHPSFEQVYPDLEWRSASARTKKETLEKCTAVISAVPRRHALELISEIEAVRAGIAIYDCSGMHRAKPGWEYALPELNPGIKPGTNRLVGPGCFATAASLALSPIKGQLKGPIFIEAIGGASTGGKKWVSFFEKNPSHDICVPNAGLNHPHIAEIQDNLSLPAGTEIRMIPQLARRYRGTTMAIHGNLCTSENIAYGERVTPWERVVDRREVPTWNDVVNSDTVHVHWVQQGPQFTIHVAYDNLGKGSVGQALQSLDISLS